MRPLLLTLLLIGCSQSVEPPPPPPASACQDDRFEGSVFTVCDGQGQIEIRTGSRSFATLQDSLGDRADRVAVAMNAGMFDDAAKPIGLMVEDGREVHAINRRKGFGNFHLMPNGVFFVRRSGKADIVTSAAFQPSADISYATQSGPMLLIDGELHPKIDPDGASHFVRNGVGIGPDGDPRFVISLDAVSFGKLARFMRDRLKIRDALYFDGSVSSLWDPVNNRMDAFTELGPIVVAFKPEASAPRRASPATP
ncbi:MAG: phosphodiester glycosidase family protein [Sphingomicrobium sp.]